MSLVEYRRLFEVFIIKIDRLKKDVIFYEEKRRVMNQIENLCLSADNTTDSSQKKWEKLTINWVPEEELQNEARRQEISSAVDYIFRCPLTTTTTTYPLNRIQPTKLSP